jgi:hypothetical protein
MFKRILLIILLLIILICAILFLIVFRNESKNLEVSSADSADHIQNNIEINFRETGTAIDENIEKSNDGLYLEYQEPGFPLHRVALLFDENSICTFSEQQIECIALNITIDTAIQGQFVTITGITEGNAVLVRTLKIAKKK